MVNRIGSQSTSHSFSPSFDVPATSTKRRRQPSEPQLPAAPSPVNGDGKAKSRRIDPDRLAARLGPELTSEMDAFIKPGAKMPTFEVRQELVRKYNVDRRHIYDYFHSRGLRVAKEDKHLNLSHRMSRKPNPPVKPTPPANLPQHTDSEPTSCDTELSPPPPANLPPKLSKYTAKRGTKEPSCLPPLKITISPLLPALESMDLLSDSSSDSDVSDSEATNSPLFDDNDMDGLTESSSFGLVDDGLDSLSLGYPSDEFSGFMELEYPPSPEVESPEGLLFNQSPPDTTGKYVSTPGTLLPLDDLARLSQDGRMELYNLINQNLGPARGIEESAGTYKAHMARLHVNRLSPPTRPLPRLSYDYTRPLYLESPTGKENINPEYVASRTLTDSQLSNDHHTSNRHEGPSFLYRAPPHPTFSPRRDNPYLLHLPAGTGYPIKPSHASPKILSAAQHTILPPEVRPNNPPFPLTWTSPIKYPSTSSRASQVLLRTPHLYYPSGDGL
ncbi:hypothetical protein C8J57DRAFT_9947 [Mycena rebaudengoi]|nr:hypothetical protein C8J57DRAFT_9947 [Mycena rebaudengoi]